MSLPRLMLALSGFALISACAAAGGPARETVLRIDPPAPTAAISPAKGIIALAPVRAVASASGQRYTYIDPAAPREVRSAATLYWEEAPAKMLERAIVQGLSARIGSVVIDNMVGLGETRRLTVELDRFEEVSGPSAKAIVAVRATLVDAKTRQLLFTAPVCRSATILGARPSDRSAAFETAIGGVLDDIAIDVLAGADRAEPRQC